MQATVLQGKVCAVDYAAACIKAVFEDRENTVTPWLPMLCGEYRLPAYGDAVVCLFLSNNPARGYCLGTPGAESPVTGAGAYCKQLGTGASVQFDPSSGTLTLTAPHVVINGTEVGS